MAAIHGVPLKIDDMKDKGVVPCGPDDFPPAVQSEMEKLRGDGPGFSLAGAHLPIPGHTIPFITTTSGLASTLTSCTSRW